MEASISGNGTFSMDDGMRELSLLKAKLKQAAQGLQPAIFRRRTREAELLQELGIRVVDWGDIRQGYAFGDFSQLRGATHPRSTDHLGPYPVAISGGVGAGARSQSIPKVSKLLKSKSNSSGRTYTSRFRGVHQTFPTKRWEAQFRRNGKPTSLGCFDHEEEAAKAYDKMMLWCEIHNAAGVKGGISNFEASVYEHELPWLQQCTQDELIDSLRSEGRRQAAHRMLKQKRDVPHGTTDEEGPSGSAVTEN
ncbi:hypothetical protein CEUSTIGMA_g7753.t1 [Chlamydomonas eustigma]|uniref:AP2/ERF domain-containing protein n=1 Tax=Chlamydomonas eustigma TaxID=1157962 RepID=A0A250XB45_9CHLO|nr:hypothetical protein CEUSTIGMA_g7753.t1 [Chlamydomonas eustigma]|eukprot:GAX80315.1 hypothetical protein CEUSTIGMA_g7753.t1 [Chlamydomonas eustigma]